MLRVFGLAIALTLFSAQGLLAQQWAQKMFKARTHNFGTVARGAKAEFAFEIENHYAVDVHITGVRTSCGCTSPRITKQTLATYEKGSIVAIFNTGKFTGSHGATLTVTFDKPAYAEVQLSVAGYIRNDVVVEPGSLAFGPVEQGKVAERTARIRYHGGRSDWRVLEVRGLGDHVDAQLTPNRDPYGRVAYDLVARLKPTAPAGYLRQELTLVTNDPAAREVPILVEGNVVAPITLSPASLFLGVVHPGQQVVKKLIVRSNKPFKIVAVDSDDDRFNVELTDSKKRLHILPVTFTAGMQTAKVVGTIVVRTDLGESATAQCTASAAIVEGIAAR